jgi:hypothetical protein
LIDGNKSLDQVLARFTNIRESFVGRTFMSFPIIYIFEILYWLESQGKLPSEVSNAIHGMLIILNLLKIQSASDNKGKIWEVIIIQGILQYLLYSMIMKKSVNIFPNVAIPY